MKSLFEMNGGTYHEENGYLIPVGDSDALADRLTRLLADEDMTAAMGRKAAKLQDGYRPDRVNAEWEAYLMHGKRPKEEAYREKWGI